MKLIEIPKFTPVIHELLLPPKVVFKIQAYRGEVLPGEIPDPSRLVWEQEVENLIVNNGKALMLKRLAGTNGPPAALTSGGVGTDSTAAAVGQIKLNPTVVGSVSLIAADATFPTTDDTTTPAAPVTTWKFTYGTAAANFSWNEGALFNGVVNGTSIMFDRAVFGPFVKSVAVSIIMTVSVTQG